MKTLLKNPKIQLLLKLIVSGFILYFLLSYKKIDFSKIKEPLSDIRLMTALTLLIGIALLLNSYRWFKILSIQSINTSLSSIYKFTLIGIFFNFLLPSSVGGDVVKAILAANKWGEKKAKLLLSVLIDRVFGLTVMMSLALIGYTINIKFLSEFKQVNYSVFALLLVSLVMLIGLCCLYYIPSLNINNKLLSKINLMFSGMKKSKDHIFEIIICLVMSLGSALCHICFIMLVFNYYGVQLPVYTFLFCIPIATVMTALPISPGGVGVGQAVYFYMFNIFGDGLGEIAFLAITILQIVYFIWAVLGSICFTLTPMTLKEVQVDR